MEQATARTEERDPSGDVVCELLDCLSDFFAKAPAKTLQPRRRLRSAQRLQDALGDLIVVAESDRRVTRTRRADQRVTGGGA